MSIVIPARDEVERLPALLDSLAPLLRHVSRSRPGSLAAPTMDAEVIVVDDASSDGTGDLARAGGADVVRLEERDRPDGWLGKPHACWRGAARARGEWLLFLDADVRLAPAAVPAAVRAATEANVAALSLLLRQRCETFWERVLLPYAYQQFFAGVDPTRLADPASAEALLNGQFLLVHRDAYERVGGHGAVRQSVAEDVALARVLKQAGLRVLTLRGEHLGDVRMYTSLRAVADGFGKNAYAFLADEPLRGARVALATTGAAATVPLLALAALRRGVARRAALGASGAGWLAFSAGLAPWVRRFGAPAWYVALQPLGALVFQAIAVRSTWRSLTGRGVAWKGRTVGRGAALAPSLPVAALLALGTDLTRGRRRSLRADNGTMVRQLSGRWRSTGLEHVPEEGPVCLVANHWQRRGLWIGWAGSLAGWLVGQRRPADDPPVRWLVLAELRLPVLGRERHLRVFDTFLHRVTYAWDLVELSLEPAAASQRAGALRALRRLAEGGKVVGFFPEGHHGAAGPLGTPLSGSGRLLRQLARRGVAVVPVAFHEQGGVLVAAFGASVTADYLAAAGDDAALDGIAMRALAALLPAPWRGRWGKAAAAVPPPPAAVPATQADPQ